MRMILKPQAEIRRNVASSLVGLLHAVVKSARPPERKTATPAERLLKILLDRIQ